LLRPSVSIDSRRKTNYIFTYRRSQYLFFIRIIILFIVYPIRCFRWLFLVASEWYYIMRIDRLGWLYTTHNAFIYLRHTNKNDYYYSWSILYILSLTMTSDIYTHLIYAGLLYNEYSSMTVLYCYRLKYIYIFNLRFCY